MTQDEAIAIARDAAERCGWPWVGVIRADYWERGRLMARLLGPRSLWSVSTNQESRGRNVYIVIDNETGAVLAKHYNCR